MTKKKDLYQIGEVAQKSGLSIDTIRYYEKQELLTKPVRSNGGFRQYPSETIGQLMFIKKARKLGLKLVEIKKVQKEQKKSQASCCKYVQSLLNKKLEELEAKQKEIHDMKKDINSIVKNWIPLKESKKKKFVVCPQIEGGRSPRQ